MLYVCAGQIGKPIGIKGYAKIHSFMCSAQVFLLFKNKFYWGSGLKIEFSNLEARDTNEVIGKLNNINSRSEIEKFKFQKIFIKREDLPNLQQNEYYYCDLVNLPIFANTGEYLGIVKSVHNYGAGDFLEILLKNNIVNNKRYNSNITDNPKGGCEPCVIATIPFNKNAILEVQKEKIIINTDFILI